MALRLDTLVAIDAHVHVEADGHGHFSLDDELLAASAKYFKAEHNRTPTVEEIAGYYRERAMAAVVFTVDAHVATGHPALSSLAIVEASKAFADTLIPFASVDPNDGASAVALLNDLVDAGARGLKLHPSVQRFLPNDPAHYPLYETAAARRLPIIVHTGQTLYVVGELTATLHTFTLAESEGHWHEAGTVSTSVVEDALPSEVDLRGRWLYVANRGPDTIAVFDIAGGRPVRVGEVSTGGAWPRHFAIVDRFLYVANERSHTVFAFALDPATGMPVPTGDVLPTPSPTCVLPWPA